MITKWLLYVRWPVIIGLLAALLVLQIFPDWTASQQSTPAAVDQNINDLVSPDPVSSYSDAVDRATPAVVSVYAKGSSAEAIMNAQQFFAIYDKNPDFYYLYVNTPECRFLFDTDPRFRERYHTEPTFRDSLRYAPLMCEVYQRTLSTSTASNDARGSLGSGVIATSDGYILTNKHVVDKAETIVVQLRDGQESNATLVGIDEENDLAVLKIEADNLTAIPIGSPQNAKVGDVVLAIGNPVGIGQTVTQGIISATGRKGLGINAIENFIQTDAAINPGNSGGALIDAYGNLLGINTAIFDRAGSSDLDGVGLAVPVTTAVQSLKEIVQYGRVERGWLGVEAERILPRVARKLGLTTTSGLIITRVIRGSPAHLSGLQRGDVILKIGEEWVGNGAKGQQKIAESRPGDKVKIDFYRSGQTKQTEATLAKKPAKLQPN